MSTNGRKSQSGEVSGFDRALGAWPAADSAADGQARIERVVARIEALDAAPEGDAASTPSPSDDELFASPLPRTRYDEDGDASISRPAVATASSRERLRERQNLKDLAKLAEDLDARAERESHAARRAGEAHGDDSGIIHLASTTRSDPATKPTKVELAPTPAPAPASKAASERPAADAKPTADVPSAASVRRPRRGMVLALYATTSVALASAAAAVFLFVQTRTPASMTVAAAPERPAAAPSSAPLLPATSTATATTEPPPEPSVLALGTDPNSLPSAPTPGATQPRTKTAGRESDSPPRAGTGPASSAAVANGDRGRPSDLGSAIQREVGDDARERLDTREKTPAAAITGAGEVPQRPAQGALTGAIGSVLPAARRCLGPDDPVSHAAIVFASSGSVQSVTVTGPASGKPTESCIKDALSKAKVPPFAEPTSTANITIRHL